MAKTKYEPWDEHFPAVSIGYYDNVEVWKREMCKEDGRGEIQRTVNINDPGRLEIPTIQHITKFLSSLNQLKKC